MRNWIAGLLALVTVSAHAAPLVTPVADRRPADQTFLTAPEWFLVFSPEEYARALGSPDRSPSSFPFFRHIGQFWQSYRAVAAECAPLPANGGYHVMVAVIGVSTTVEYALKGVYEGVVGRFTELVAGRADTPEDRLGAKVAQDYVDFIKLRPWYEFDFMTPAKALWNQPSGGNIIRRWERRYVLTSEYLVKAGYAQLIGIGTRLSYDTPIERTVAIVRTPDGMALPAGTKLIARQGALALIDAPRMQAFQDVAIAIARQGGVFDEIAGNRHEILVTLVMTERPPPGGREIYTQPILTRPRLTRYAIAYPVNRLAGMLRVTPANQVEHIYDF